MTAPLGGAAFWTEVEELFQAVLDSPEAARGSALDMLTDGKPHHRRELKRLLSAHEQGGSQLTPVTVGGAARDNAHESIAGELVGSFRLIELIGEGGMGAVYRAERVAGDFTQEAAVKVMASRLAGAEVTRRFRTERQILASLQHPNIVTLLDGGVTEGGAPYLAMEFVQGEPIAGYVAHHRLSLADRLRLFLQVCDAVRFAHQHLVVHRDLKPGNVFVTDGGVVKVLDFGIAKLLQADGAAAVTALAGPLTTDYASPEQVRGEAVTTASDVYSLGVLLFELIAGQPPYRTTGKALTEVLATVLEHEPPRPSAVAEGLPYPAAKLSGDLDAIALKAMAKDVRRRYASVDELSADLRRWLEGRPVLARPDSRAYVMGRFIRRHAVASAMALVAALAVFAGLGVAIWQARIAQAERDRATEEMRTALAATEFLGSVFDAANPVTARGATITARNLLDAGADRIATALGDRPDAQVRLLAIMGRAYNRIGVPDRALALADRALATARAHPSASPGDLADSLALVGEMRRRFNRQAEAIQPLEEAIALFERLYGPNDARIAETLRDLALAREALDSGTDVRPLIERAIRIQEETAPNRASLGRLWNNLGNMHIRKGDEARALEAFDRSIAIYERSNEPDSWGLALPLLSLGDVLREREELVRARTLFERALVIDDETFGRVSTSSAYTLARLADVATAEGRLAEARRLLDESRAIYARTESATGGPRTLQAFAGRLELAAGRADAARRIFADQLAAVEALHGRSHLETATALIDLAAADLALNLRDEARALLERAIAIRRTVVTGSRTSLVRPLTLLAAVDDDHGRRRELLQEAVTIAGSSLPAAHSHRVNAEAALRAIGPG